MILYSGFADEISPVLAEQSAALQRLGISFVELRGVNGTNVSDLTDAEAAEASKQLKDAGIAVSAIGSPIGKISITDDFEAHFEKFLHTLDLAEIFGTDRIRLFSFYIPKDEDPSVYREEVLYRMKRMTAEAEKRGIVLQHENEKEIYGDSAERCLDIFKSVGSPYLRATFDPANFVQCQEDPLAAYRLLFPYITYMHIKDARKDGTVVTAGEGDGHVEEILSDLLRHGYSGFLSLEPHLTDFNGLASLERENRSTIAHREEEPEELFRYAFEALQDIMKRMDQE